MIERASATASEVILWIAQGATTLFENNAGEGFL
jgi:hypothetical protein